MTTHPYIRAYLAGIAVPTLFLLLAVTGFFVARYVLDVPVPIERAIPFPMAIVPNLFGVLNIFYVLLHSHRHLPIGLHGALLPFVLAPIAFTVATSLGLLSVAPRGLVLFQTMTVPYAYVATLFVCALVVYYLVWKYLVGFLNELLGIA